LKITLPKRLLATIHPLNVTFFPASFQRQSLTYATHNGGEELEKFKMSTKIHHSQPISSLISASNGLGATEGLVIVGDDRKQLKFRHEQTQSAIVPSIHFLPMEGKNYFLRMHYSAQEIDETFKENSEANQIRFHFETTT
jgi:hypothetical protein